MEGEIGRLARVAAGIVVGEFAMRRHAQGDAELRDKVERVEGKLRAQGCSGGALSSHQKLRSMQTTV